eukprot:TRINITY_DN1944_c1_g1_i1.p1 TRINITY_DN1944_c1_g1~~TRINITY_DN1944_c1_g1_i1.p1  ORF type:complete len:539 (+),score=60.70 TRINITY_DN1944_c1_g1_i1:182-1798(+)
MTSSSAAPAAQTEPAGEVFISCRAAAEASTVSADHTAAAAERPPEALVHYLVNSDGQQAWRHDPYANGNEAAAPQPPGHRSRSVGAVSLVPAEAGPGGVTPEEEHATEGGSEPGWGPVAHSGGPPGMPYGAFPAPYAQGFAAAAAPPYASAQSAALAAAWDGPAQHPQLHPSQLRGGGPPAAEPCVSHANGKCKRGAKCRYSHWSAPAGPPAGPFAGPFAWPPMPAAPLGMPFEPNLHSPPPLPFGWNRRELPPQPQVQHQQQRGRPTAPPLRTPPRSPRGRGWKEQSPDDYGAAATAWAASQGRAHNGGRGAVTPSNSQTPAASELSTPRHPALDAPQGRGSRSSRRKPPRVLTQQPGWAAGVAAGGGGSPCMSGGSGCGRGLSPSLGAAPPPSDSGTPGYTHSGAAPPGSAISTPRIGVGSSKGLPPPSPGNGTPAPPGSTVDSAVGSPENPRPSGSHAESRRGTSPGPSESTLGDDDVRFRIGNNGKAHCKERFLWYFGEKEGRRQWRSSPAAPDGQVCECSRRGCRDRLRRGRR